MVPLIRLCSPVWLDVISYALNNAHAFVAIESSSLAIDTNNTTDNCCLVEA